MVKTINGENYREAVPGVGSILNLYGFETRPTSLDIDLGQPAYSGKVTYMLATGSVTEGMPPANAAVLNLGWDNSKWGAQLAIGNGTGALFGRGFNANINVMSWGKWREYISDFNINAFLQISGPTYLAQTIPATNGLPFAGIPHGTGITDFAGWMKTARSGFYNTLIGSDWYNVYLLKYENGYSEDGKKYGMYISSKTMEDDYLRWNKMIDGKTGNTRFIVDHLNYKELIFNHGTITKTTQFEYPPDGSHIAMQQYNPDTDTTIRFQISKSGTVRIYTKTGNGGWVNGEIDFAHLENYFLPLAGGAMTGNLIPAAGNQLSIGTGNSRWNGLYVENIRTAYQEAIKFLTTTANSTGNPQGFELVSPGGSTAAYLRPVYDSNSYLGDANKKWRQVYADTGTISTSDRNQKKEISYTGKNSNYDTYMPDGVLMEFINGLLPCIYRLADNDSNRPHHGLIAQDVEELIQKLGIKDHAAFIKSPKTRDVEVEEEYTDKDGSKRTRKRTVQEEIPGEYIYGLRYEEFIADIIRFCQILYNRNTELENALEEQKKKAENLEKRIEALENIIRQAA